MCAGASTCSSSTPVSREWAATLPFVQPRVRHVVPPTAVAALKVAAVVGG